MNSRAGAIGRLKLRIGGSAGVCRRPKGFVCGLVGSLGRVGPEADPAMAPVAERLVLRGAAAAEREPRVQPDQPSLVIDDPQAPADTERAVWAHVDRRLRLRFLLRTPVEAAEVERAGRTGENRRGDGVGIGGIDVYPWPPPRVEHPTEPSDAVPAMDAGLRLPK